MVLEQKRAAVDFLAKNVRLHEKKCEQNLYPDPELHLEIIFKIGLVFLVFCNTLTKFPRFWRWRTFDRKELSI